MSLVTIGIFNTEIEASLLLMRLEQADIFCVLANTQYSNVAKGFNASIPGYHGIWVQVREEDVEQAREIMEQPVEPIDEDELAAAAEAADVPGV